jgi:hypothetical protein
MWILYNGKHGEGILKVTFGSVVAGIWRTPYIHIFPQMKTISIHIFEELTLDPLIHF